MDLTYDELALERLAGIRFADPAAALLRLLELPGESVTDHLFDRLLPGLLDCLARSADPDRALANLLHWLGQVGSRTIYCRLLIEHPAAMDAMLVLFAASQFLADILIRNPEYFELLANPRIRDRERSMGDFLADARRRVSVAPTLGKQRDALRRFKPPEVLRIGARDILGFASFEQTVAEISDFAEACVRATVEICGAQDGFAVIGMGKLGARELNYASDIDLIFVHADDMPQQAANKLGEAVRDTLATVTDAGFLFRVDLRLRPEGRFGAISRSVSACRAYYESWAEPWERQALIKARVVGGDEAIGEQFIGIADQFVYRKLVTQDFVDAIRAGKRRLEAQTERAGEANSNVKQGVGAIRDVEFAVQLLQLIAGGKHPELRHRATIAALDALAGVGLITDAERALLADSYRFLRNVEHRLQIMDERPVRVLPLANPAELDKFGRRLGYRDGPAFLLDYGRRTALVNELFRALFYGESVRDMGADSSLETTSEAARISEWVAGIEDQTARENLLRILGDMGFAEPQSAVTILASSEVGSDYGDIAPDARRRFADLAPHLLGAAVASGRPDQALRAFDQLSIAVPSRAALYRTLSADTDFLDRLLLLAGGAPSLWLMVIAHLEYLDLLADGAQLDQPASLPSAADEAAVAAFVRHERLRIAVRDLWGMAGVQLVMDDLTAMAAAMLETAMKLTEFEDIASEIALVGVGKLGGAELGYGSDLDVLWVASDRADTVRAAQYANRVMAFIQQDLKRHGAPYEIDARLRPDGRVGVLVRTVDGYAQYLAESAQTWEKQALIKSRFVAGNKAVGASFELMARRTVYDHPLSGEQAEELRHMKRRIETERCKDPADIKLGPGGLSDIEWVAQMLQWRHGKRWPKAQATGTLPALAALRDAAVLRQDDWDVLTAAYLDLTWLRNRRYLAEAEVEAPAGMAEQRRNIREIFQRLFLGDVH